MNRCFTAAVILMAFAFAASGETTPATLPSTDSAIAAPQSIQSTDSALSTPARDPRWAVPIEKPGLPNLHKVSDDLYRGAQPTSEGFKALKEMGIRTVVNLRAFHSDKDEMGDLAFDYVNIDVKTWHAEDEDVVRFLKIVTDKTKAPVFVHCEHGADRTGMMIAVYRIAVEGWSKEDALKEMTEGGFGWHPVWQNLLDYIRDLDVEALKKTAGFAGPKQGS